MDEWLDFVVDADGHLHLIVGTISLSGVISVLIQPMDMKVSDKISYDKFIWACGFDFNELIWLLLGFI